MSEPSHLPVLVESLEPTESLPFRLFVQLGDSLILFRTAKDRLAAVDIEELLRAEKIELVTSAEESAAYIPQLSKSVEAVKDMPGPPRKKLEECYRRSAVATQHILQNAASPEGGEAAHSLSSTMLELLEECAFEFAATSNLADCDPSLAQHSLRVSVQGLLLGKAVGYPQLAELGVGLLLHDLGELSLSEEERKCADPAAIARYRSHPKMGLDMVSEAPWCSPVVRDLVENHHERLDRSGFPGGLAKEAISPAVRIAAIVDTFDERVHGSPRNEPRSNFEVLQEMLQQEAGLYDMPMLQTYVKLQMAKQKEEAAS